MTTTITPSSGAAPLYCQQGTGTTPGYSALDDRRQASGTLQEGVFGTATLVTAGGVANVGQADFMVTQRNAGANQTVDINMPAGGYAWVQGDTLAGGSQALYCVPVHSANINEVIAGADPTNPRVDQVILEVLDNVIDASGNNLARTRVLTGTPTASATLTNRFGAAALPGSALLLADVLVPAASSSVPNANIRDRRKWARGAFVRISRNANAAAGNDYTSAGTSFALVDGTNIQPRIECSGVPLRLRILGSVSNSTAPTTNDFGFMQDGAQIADSDQQWTETVAADLIPLDLEYSLVPTGGSHLFGPSWKVGSGTITLLARVAFAAQFIVEEVVRSTTPNNTVTSG